MALKPDCLATGIGSLPHTDAEEAVDDMLTYLTDIPAWPQLPQRKFTEDLCVQYSEGLPSVQIDDDKETLSVDTGKSLTREMQNFSTRYDDLEQFSMSEEYAAGLQEFISRGGSYPYVKGHITGPITWGLTIYDQDLNPAYDTEELMEGIVKGLRKKAQWQIEQLAPLGDEVLLFIDEPRLHSIYSSTTLLDKDTVIRQLDELITAIQDAGAYAGVHCCANTDWSLLTQTAVDIISFDAWNYAEEFSLHLTDIEEYLNRGGVIAWGIVPTGDEIETQDADSILAAFKEAIQPFIDHGISEELILEQALITPSCGAGTLTKDRSLKILELTTEVSRALRE